MNSCDLNQEKWNKSIFTEFYIYFLPPNIYGLELTCSKQRVRILQTTHIYYIRHAISVKCKIHAFSYSNHPKPCQFFTPFSLFTSLNSAAAISRRHDEGADPVNQWHERNQQTCRGGVRTQTQYSETETCCSRAPEQRTKSSGFWLIVSTSVSLWRERQRMS